MVAISRGHAKVRTASRRRFRSPFLVTLPQAPAAEADV